MLRRLYLFLLIFNFPICSIAQDSCINKSLKQLIEDYPQHFKITLENINGRPPTHLLSNIQPVFDTRNITGINSKEMNSIRGDIKNYHILLSRESDLSPETIYTLMTNFHFRNNSPERNGINTKWSTDAILDGSMGLFKTEDDLVVDVNQGIIGAYKKAQQFVEKEKIEVKDLIELSEATWLYRSVKDGQDIVKSPLTWKSGTSTIRGVHPDVIQKAKSYGIEVTKKNGSDEYVFYYGKRTDPTLETITKKRLELFVNRLNEYIKLDISPERTVAMAVQDYLIIHPRNNMNGRNARILGQVLYKKLTGKNIIFDEHFHNELNYNEVEIAQSLKKISPHSFEQILLQKVYESFASKEYADVPSSNPKTQDKRFGEFTVNSEKKQYKDVQADLGSHPNTLYYGKPAFSKEELERIIFNVFTQGRNTRKSNSHYNVNWATESTSPLERPSGFMQSTDSPHIANSFGQMRRILDNKFPTHSLVFIIDSKGAEVLDVNKAVGIDNSLHASEKEFLFYNTIAPTRIKGVMITPLDDFDQLDYDQSEIIYNPNYLPR